MKQIASLVMTLFLAGTGLAEEPSDLSKPVRLSPETLAKLGDPSFQVTAPKALAEDPNIEMLKMVVSYHLTKTGFTVIDSSPLPKELPGYPAGSPEDQAAKLSQDFNLADIQVVFDIHLEKLGAGQQSCQTAISIFETNTGYTLASAVEQSKGFAKPAASGEANAACTHALQKSTADAVHQTIENLLHDAEVGWYFIITVVNSPANLDVILGDGLRKLCESRRVATYENQRLEAIARCKVEESEFPTLLRKILETASPKKEFELSLRHRRALVVRFR
jgi:hypothetical protein